MKPCKGNSYTFKDNKDAEHIASLLSGYDWSKEDWDIDGSIICIYNKEVHVSIKECFKTL